MIHYFFILIADATLKIDVQYVIFTLLVFSLTFSCTGKFYCWVLLLLKRFLTICFQFRCLFIMHVLSTVQSSVNQVLRQFYSVDKHFGIFHLATNRLPLYNTCIRVRYSPGEEGSNQSILCLQVAMT